MTVEAEMWGKDLIEWLINDGFNQIIQAVISLRDRNLELEKQNAVLRATRSAD